ncbi:hypothetical protein HI914_00433 [Erysiphe necator]|nr:hypothetical protein HI914_00433 [Erysiphe necator]
MGSRAKHKSKQKLKSKQNISKSKKSGSHKAPKPSTKSFSRGSTPCEASDTRDYSNFEARKSSCLSNFSSKRFPIYIISQDDFKADPTRPIRASRNLGTRSDDLDTLLFQSYIDEILETSNKTKENIKNNIATIPTLLTETAKLEQGLYQILTLDKTHSCEFNEAFQQSSKSVIPEELSITEFSSNTSVLNIAPEEKEQMMQQTTEENLIPYRPETTTPEPSKERIQTEITNTPIAQDDHKKHDANDLSDSSVESMIQKKDDEHNEESIKIKPKRKRANRKKKKKKTKSELLVVEESNKTSSVAIVGTKLNIDVTAEEKDILEILNYYTMKGIREADDDNQYIRLIGYHCFITRILQEKPDVYSSLKLKFDRINSKRLEVHQFMSSHYHFTQAILYCAMLGKTKHGTDKLEEFYYSYIDTKEFKECQDTLESRSNNNIITYYRFMAEQGSLHPTEWYKSLREIYENINKIRPFPGLNRVDEHWSDIAIIFTCSDENIPSNDQYEELLASYLGSERIFQQGSWYFWQSVRRLPWVNPIEIFKINKILATQPNPNELTS